MSYRKCVCILLMIAVLLSPAMALAAQRYYPGDEWPAEQNQLGTSDVAVQKTMDSVLYPLGFAIAAGTVSLGTGTIAKNAVAKTFNKMFTDMAQKYAKKYGYAAAGGGGVAAVNGGSTLLWMNWPASKYSFSSPSGNVVLDVVDNAVFGIFDSISSSIFSIPKSLVLITNNLIILAFDTQWIQSASTWISDSTRKVAGDFVGSGKHAFSRVLFILCLAIMGAGIALYLARGQLVKAGKVFFTSVLCVAFLIFYVINSHYIINTVADFADGIAGIGMELSAAVLADDENPATAHLTGLEKGLVQASNSAWAAIIAIPWSYGQFGTADVSKLVMTYDSGHSKSEWDVFSVDVPEQTSFPPSKIGKRLTRSDLEAKASAGKLYMDTLYLGSDDQLRKKLLTAISVDQAGFIGFRDTVDHGNHPEVVSACQQSMSSALRHLGVACFTIVPALAYLAFGGFMSIPIIVAQLALMLLLIFFPIAIIAGIAGERGQMILKKYLNVLLGAFAIKVINGIYLGIVLFFGSIISESLLF